MARRKDHTREELRQLAIEQALKLVREKGADQLTARKVAEAIGYAPGTLYNIFNNLAGLVEAVNAETLHGLASRMEAETKRCKSPRGKLSRICQLYLDLQLAEPELCSLIFATPQAEIEDQSEAYSKAVHAVFDQVTSAIRPLCTSDKAARQDAKIIWSSLHGLSLLHRNGKLIVGEPDDPKQLAKRFLDRFLRGR